jgi:hypothetical protein
MCLCLCEFVCEVGFSPGNRSDCAYEEHVYTPVDVYDVCGFSVKYNSVLLHHHEWKTKGLGPFALRSCHIYAQHTDYIPSFLRTNCLTFWHPSFTFNSNKSTTWCNSFSVYYPDVCLQLNMFRTFSRPSSGVQWLQWQPLVLPSYRGDSRAVFVVGPALVITIFMVGSHLTPVAFDVLMPRVAFWGLNLLVHHISSRLWKVKLLPAHWNILGDNPCVITQLYPSTSMLAGGKSHWSLLGKGWSGRIDIHLWLNTYLITGWLCCMRLCNDKHVSKLDDVFLVW